MLDHLAAYKLTDQECQEWSVKMWISICHSPLWNALEQCGIESNYVSLLGRLFKGQKGSVLTNKESDAFEVNRGTKQGDPLSSSLFNTVLQVALKDDLVNWQRKGMGIRLGDSEPDCLTNLRFPDDVLLFSTSLEQLLRIMCDFKRSTGKVWGCRSTWKKQKSSAIKIRTKEER